MDRRRAAGALLALAACIACSAAAPTASNHTALDLYEGAKDGCYYNFQHYGEGDRIMTNEPCLNCTCHNRMLMCYLRVCPFTKPIGQDCTVEKRADQCCPIVTCPDVPVDLLTYTSTTSPAEYGATGLGKLDKYGCSINGRYFPEGSKVPPTPNKPCEHCYCIRNMTTCVMQECTLHVDGCTPIYHKDVCCPVRYSCDHPEDEIPLLDDMSTTVRPTPGFLLTTTTMSPVTQMSQDCVHNYQMISDGASIRTERACEHCYCMKGDIVCVVQECGAPMENEGKNCTSLPPRDGQCCPDTYICEGDEPNADVVTESLTDALEEKLSTLSPPRRTGVEGSGYRNEDEVAQTQLPTVELELEGSGEEQETPHGTQEPFISDKPIGSEEMTHSLEESDQYIPVTSKASEHVSQVTETSNDNIKAETVEPEISMVTTQLPTQEDFDKMTEVTKVNEEKPYEHEATVSPGLPEGLDISTVESSEFLNTVSDIHPDQELGKPHEYASTTMGIPIKEIVTDEQDENKKPVDTILDNEQGTTLKPVSQGPLVPVDATMYPETSTKIEDATTKKSYDMPESVTIAEILKPEIHVDAMTTVSDIEEIRTIAPQKLDTTSEKTLPNDSVISIEYVTSTTNIPTEEIVEKLTTELDQAQNTVEVVDEGGIYTSIPNVELAQKTTPSEIQVDVSSPVSITRVQEQSTIEPDKELNTITSEANEETTRAALLETRNTEPTVTGDATEHLEIETKLSTISEFSTTSLDTRITKGDQYTITTEPSFRKEDEASVSTEKPKEEAERTTEKTDLVDEGLIPTSMIEKEFETGSNLPSVDEYITTGIPDYIDTDKELGDTVASVKPVTETVPATAFVSDSVTEKLTITPSKQESGLLSSTEKSMEVTVLSTVDDDHDEPSRIPGEGDCLLNTVTYRNNTVVPSTNKCHIGCKCVSSIIKCDPIICSPLPENMHNCQSIYDNPDSCCPTYICDSRETVPPKSDSQMSGMESPVPPPIIECRGDQCELSKATKEPLKPVEPCTSDSCVPAVIQDSKPQDGQKILCKEENGCQPQEILPSDCTGDEPCRRKDTHIEQKLPPKCEGSHCIQEITTETAMPHETRIEGAPIKNVPAELLPSEPIDTQVTKHSENMTAPIAQIITEKVYESTEHSLFATTEGKIIFDKITEKVDVDIATEEFILAGTETAMKPDQFEQDRTDKLTTDETVTQSVDDIKKPIEKETESETLKPDIVVDDHLTLEIQTTEKPHEYPDKPTLVQEKDKEKDTKISHDVVGEYTTKPGLIDMEGNIVPIVIEEQKQPDTATEEQPDKLIPIDKKETTLTDITDIGYDNKPSHTGSQDSNVSEPINEIDITTQSALTEQEVTNIPHEFGHEPTSKSESVQDSDYKISEVDNKDNLIKEDTKTPTQVEKDVTNAPDTEEDIQKPDSFIDITKVPDIKDDIYTERIPTSIDRDTLKPEVIDKTNTDIPQAIEEQTIHANIPDNVYEEQSYKPDDTLDQKEETKVPNLVKEDTDKIIPSNDASTKLPDRDVDNYTDEIDITDKVSTQMPDNVIQKQTDTAFITESGIPETTQSVTEKGIISDDEVKVKPILVEGVEKMDLNKEEGITQSVISEDSTGLPEMIENIVTKKPLLIDESTELPVETEDTKGTKATDIIEESITDNNKKDEPSEIEVGTKEPNVQHKDGDKNVADSAGETKIPEIQASTQASITTEHELLSIITEADGSDNKKPVTLMEEHNLLSEEKVTNRPAYVTPVSVTEDGQTELYIAPINERLPETVGKDKLSTEEGIKPTSGSIVTETSYISLVSEQDIKSDKPEIYTPEKEEMITSHIDSTVTEPFKEFTEIDDIFVTEQEETATEHHEASTERVAPIATEKQIIELTSIAVPTASSVLDSKATESPQESYTESYQVYGETTHIAKTESSYIPEKPEISTSLPASAVPPGRTGAVDSENKISDSSEPTVTLAEEKPSVSLDSKDNQKEVNTKIPDESMESDLGTPISPPEMFVTKVQSPTAKPESHVTGSTEEQSEVEESEKPQKTEMPTQSHDLPAPETIPVELEIDTKSPHATVTTEASPSIIADNQLNISAVRDIVTEKDDTKQKPIETYTESSEKITDEPYINLEVTKSIEENIFKEQTSAHTDISETTPYLIELEEHTHKTAENIPGILSLDKEDNINIFEGSSTISLATEKYEGEKITTFSSDIEVTDEKESTTEKTLYSEIQLDTDRFIVTVNDITISSTTAVPEKQGEIITPDTDEKYSTPSEIEPIKPPLSEDKYSKPDEKLSEIEETILPISQDEDRIPVEKPISGVAETMLPVTVDKDGKPEEKPIIESADIVPPISEDIDSQSENEPIFVTEETITSTPEDKDKKHDETLTSGPEEILMPASVDKYVKPDELPSSETDVTMTTISEDKYDKPEEDITSPDTGDKYSKPDDVNTSEETTILPTSADTYGKPDEKLNDEAGDITTPLTEDKHDKPDDTFVSKTEAPMLSSTENTDNKLNGKPGPSESEETTPSVSEDNYGKPDEQLSGEAGDIIFPHSEDEDNKETSISGLEESMPSVSEDKYIKLNDTLSSEPETNIPSDYQDKDSKPDGKPIVEIESITPTISEDKDGISDDKPGNEINDVEPTLSEHKEDKLYEKPITEAGETVTSISVDKYEEPDVTSSSETEVTISPISVDIISESDKKPVDESEKITPTISVDKYGTPDDKRTTESGDVLTSLPETEVNISDSKPVSETEIILPSSEDKYGKPDSTPSSESETSISPLSENMYGKPDGKPIGDNQDTILPVSTEKYDKLDDKPSIGMDKIIPPLSEDKENKPGEKPVDETGEIMLLVSDDQKSKLEKKPTSEIEDILPPISEDKVNQTEEKPINEIVANVPPTLEHKDSESSEKPVTGTVEIVPSVTEETDIKPEEMPVSGLEEIVPTVSEGKQPEEETTSESGDTFLPVFGDKVSQAEQKPISDSGESVPSASEDKNSKPEEEPTIGPAETVPLVSEDKNIIPEEKPISGIEEIMPIVSEDKYSQPEDKPVTEISLPAYEDKNSKPDVRPISTFEETIPVVPEKDDSKLGNKPISGFGVTIPPGSEDKESNPDEKPISGTEEIILPVDKDKDSKPEEELINEIGEIMPPTSEDKDSKPDKKPISGSGESMPPILEDEYSKLDKKPIGGLEETAPSVIKDKDIKPEEKPISATEETLRPTTVDQDSKSEEKPISGTEETVPPFAEDEDSQPEEKPNSEIGHIVPDKDIKPDGTYSSKTETPVSVDKDSKPDEQPVSSTGETEPEITKDKDNKPEEKPVSGTEEMVPPVNEDKYINPDGTLSNETDATIPSVSEDKFSKPDEVPTSQTTENMPPIADDNYGKPDGQPSKDSLPPSATSELPKPVAEAHPTDDLPVPEEDSHFPPSGTGYGEPDYVEEDQAFGPGTCRYGGKVYVSAQQIPRDDPCDFCFCFRSDIICLQQSCPPPIHGCHEEPIQGFCCPRYECPVSMATTVNVTTTTTTTTTTLPPHFPTHSYKGAAQRRGCQIKGHTYKVGDVVRSSSGPCLHCTCGGDGQMKCDPKVCTPEPMLRQMIAAAVSAKRRR